MSGGRDENIALILGRRVIEAIRSSGCEKPLLLSIALRNKVEEDGEEERSITEQLYKVIDENKVWSEVPG